MNDIAAIEGLLASARPISLPRPKPLPTTRASVSFKALLQPYLAPALNAQSETSLHTVTKGETLSHICRGFLEAQGAHPTQKRICDAVTAVARANHLENPDLIHPGQKLDLSTLRNDSSSTSTSAFVQVLPRADLVTPISTPVRQASLVERDSEQTARAVAKSGSRNLPRIISTVLHASPTDPSLSPLESLWNGMVDESARLTSQFGTRKDPFTGEWEHHAGIDLATAKGAAIYPIQSGTVVFSGWKAGYGKVVIVRHESGLETVYGHNAKNLVRVGDAVTRRSQIATVGETGRTTGPHLHFEIRRGGRALDPLPFIRSNSVQIAEAL